MRYILVDQYSGFVWGDTTATDPVEACRKIDAEIGDHDRTYVEHGPYSAARRVETGGYHVYEAPTDFPEIDDGQDQAAIDMVSRLPCVAFVESFRTAAALDAWSDV